MLRLLSTVVVTRVSSVLTSLVWEEAITGRGVEEGGLATTCLCSFYSQLISNMRRLELPGH